MGGVTEWGRRFMLLDNSSFFHPSSFHPPVDQRVFFKARHSYFCIQITCLVHSHHRWVPPFPRSRKNRSPHRQVCPRPVDVTFLLIFLNLSGVYSDGWVSGFGLKSDFDSTQIAPMPISLSSGFGLCFEFIWIEFDFSTLFSVFYFFSQETNFDSFFFSTSSPAPCYPYDFSRRLEQWLEISVLLLDAPFTCGISPESDWWSKQTENNDSKNVPQCELQNAFFFWLSQFGPIFVSLPWKTFTCAQSYAKGCARKMPQNPKITKIWSA